jgi:hypothetical protein
MLSVLLSLAAFGGFCISLYFDCQSIRAGDVKGGTRGDIALALHLENIGAIFFLIGAALLFPAFASALRFTGMRVLWVVANSAVYTLLCAIIVLVGVLLASDELYSYCSQPIV